MSRSRELSDAPAPLLDHLQELRRRVGIAVLAVLVGAVATFAWCDALIALLRTPLNGTPLYFVGIGDAFGIRMQLSLIGGVALAMPIWLWQAWAFIRPGLTDAERRAARPWIPLALLLFIVGVGVAWVVLPFAVSFLLSFATSDLTPLIAADRYFRVCRLPYACIWTRDGIPNPAGIPLASGCCHLHQTQSLATKRPGARGSRGRLCHTRHRPG